MNNITKIILILMFCLSLIACDNKNSLVGFPGSHINSYQVTIPDSCFDLAYTWGDSIRIYSNNTKLLLGNHDNIEARTLILFNNIPEDVTIQSGTAKLYIKVNNKAYCNAMLVSVNKITKEWSQNQANWSNSTSSTTWSSLGGDYTPISSIGNVTINSSTDTLMIELPTSLIQEWSDSNSLNYGIMLTQNNPSDNQFVEFYSSNTAYIGPRLDFDYVKTNGDTISYSRYAAADCFIHNQTERITQIDENNLSIWNLPSKAMVFKARLPWELFRNAGATNINSEEDLKTITINRAELVLQKNSDVLSNTNKKFNLYSCFVNSTFSDKPNIFNSTSYTASQLTIDSLKTNNQLFVNVTPLIQGYVTKKKSNNGFIVKSNYQNMDFSRTNFYGLLANDPTKRPKIVIKFSSFR